MSCLSRFRNLWRRPALDREFDDELAFHVDQLTEKYLRQGLSREEAARKARQHAGNTLAAKEDMREARVMMWLDTLARDLVYGARMFRRQPATTALAVLTLSLGIGANAVIYSLLHAALIRPLPFPSPERLVGVVDNFTTANASDMSPTIPEILDVRDASRTLDAISFYDTRDAQINGGTEPARAVSARVEAGFLRTLGAQPALGRIFNEGDHNGGAARVAVLSDAFWRRNFGADVGVINRSLIIDGAPHTIVGVLPVGFNFDYFTPEPIELYVPYPMIPAYTSRDNEFASVRRVIAVARLKDSTTPAQANAELRMLSDHLRAQYPQLYRRGSDGQDLGFWMGTTPMRQMVVGRARAIVWVLFAAVGLVLLIACVNTAQFLLARAVERQPEVVVRSALGAGTGRLLRQFLTEAFLLAALATVLGLIQASLLVGILRTSLASPSPLLVHLTLNPAVIVFSLGVTVIATLLCGLFPAMHLIRRRFVVDPAHATGVTRLRTRHVMIAAQVAVSVVLLSAALLVTAGLRLLYNLPSGYDAEQVVTMRLRVTGPQIPGGTGVRYQQYLQAIATVPGVQHAAFADAPLPGANTTEFSIAGRADDAATLSTQRAGWRIVSPDYFGVLRIPVIAGRTFTDDDRVNSEQVAIINESMAHQFWPNESPLGRQIRSGSGPRSRVATIVGIVGNVRSLRQLEMVPQIYVSYLQQSEPNATVLIRSEQSVPPPIDLIKRAIWSVVPNQPVYAIEPLTQFVERTVATPRLMTRLLGSFAALALIMAILGVYTVVSYLVARRTKEIALRRAIGATPRDVLQLLGIPTLRWTAIGLAAGFVGAAWGSRALGAMAAAIDMPRGSLHMPASLAALTIVVYLLIVAAAVVVPAARALRVQPGTILRAE